MLSPPEPLAAHHPIADFACGEPSLDAWLHRRARPNQASGASRAFILCDGARVVGYYALASSAVSPAAELIGIRGLLVHALSAEARAFYLRLGLEESPLSPLTLMTTLADLRAGFAGSTAPDEM